MSDNLRLWDRLKRTDPKATKPFQKPGGFRGTTIDPTWRLQMMTETFGPVGRGWGYEQLEWTIAEGCVFIRVRVWYRDPESGEVCWTGDQWGGTELRPKRRDGAEAPADEAFKMSITDALGKCLVQLGLGADIHMGQFDDSKYQREVEAYYTLKDRPELWPAAIERFEAAIQEKLPGIGSIGDLDQLYRNGAQQKLKEIALVDPAAQMRIVSYFSQRKAELQKGEKERRAAEESGEELIQDDPVVVPSVFVAAPPEPAQRRQRTAAAEQPQKPVSRADRLPSASNGHAEPAVPGSAFVPSNPIVLEGARRRRSPAFATPFFALDWLEQQILEAGDSKAVRTLFANNADFLKRCRDGADQAVASRYYDVQTTYQDRLETLKKAAEAQAGGGVSR